MENDYVVNQHNHKVEDLVWISKDNGIWLCQVLNPNMINQAVSSNKVMILANKDSFRLFNYLSGQSASRVQVTGQLGRPSSVGGTSMSANVQPEGQQTNRPKPWAPTEVQNQSELRALRIPNATSPTVKLFYKSSGDTIIALAYNGELKVWKWRTTERNATGMATTAVPPELWSPPSSVVMTNDISQTNLEQAVLRFEISRTDSYLLSASAGKISLFNTTTFKTLSTILAPSLPSAATCLAFMPRDNNIVAAGLLDVSIMIYNVPSNKVINRLRGHRNRVTVLAFSSALDLLVSSGADQICAWNVDGWENKASVLLHFLQGRIPSSSSKTKVQFHLDQTLVQVVHEMQIAIYAASKLDWIKRWSHSDSWLMAVAFFFGGCAGFTKDKRSRLFKRINSLLTLCQVVIRADALKNTTNKKRLAVHKSLRSIANFKKFIVRFSCDGQSIYVAFQNASIFVFTISGMKIKCKISPAAYLPPSNPTVSSSSTRDVFPVAIAAHPSKPNQLALRLAC